MEVGGIGIRSVYLLLGQGIDLSINTGFMRVSCLEL